MAEPQRLYVAAPMRDFPLMNWPAFESAGAYLRVMGHDAVLPTEIDEEHGVVKVSRWNGVVVKVELAPDFDLAAVLARDLEAIDTCHGIVMLPGWQKSTGAKTEHRHAVKTGKDIYYAITEVLKAEEEALIEKECEGCDECYTGTTGLTEHFVPDVGGPRADEPAGYIGVDRPLAEDEAKALAERFENLEPADVEWQDAPDVGGRDERLERSIKEWQSKTQAERDEVLRRYGVPCSDPGRDLEDAPDVGGRDLASTLATMFVPPDQLQEVRVVDPNTGGAKGSKLARFDLLPADVLWLVAEHLGKGARKYDARNWERGYDWGLSYAAMQRHNHLWWGGEDIDEETGSHHLDAVIVHALFLRAFALRGVGTDDRGGR